MLWNFSERAVFIAILATEIFPGNVFSSFQGLLLVFPMSGLALASFTPAADGLHSDDRNCTDYPVDGVDDLTLFRPGDSRLLWVIHLLESVQHIP